MVIMKVLGMYDKESEIRCFNKSAFLVMRNFFSRLPEEYGKCYFKNLETLKLLKVDEFNDDKIAGKYNSLGNVIMFSKNNSLGHELFHVASYDRSRDISAFEGHIDIEQGLIEGMTEYLFVKTYELSLACEYPFEVFCVKMLEDIPNLFKPYFIPSHEDFINLFPSKRSIYSLMYALNVYHEDALDYMASPSGNDIQHTLYKIEEAIKGVIDSLISIELSRNTDDASLNRYADKFMDELTSKEVKDMMYWLCPKYSHYANKQINVKIRRKG